MQLIRLFGILTLAILAHALPTPRSLPDEVGVTDNLIVFDAPAFPDPTNPGNTLVALQTFVSLRQADLGEVTAAITHLLETSGINVGDRIGVLQQRIKLVGAIGLPGKSTTIKVPGCSLTVKTTETSGLPDLGISFQTYSLGNCSDAKEFSGTASLGFLDNRKIGGTIFSSPDSGFGVISDIDDTIKVSNVLDKVALLKSSLLEDGKPVAGMPELYTSLSKSLDDPQFVYVSGSPGILYPFLKDFIDTSYSSAKGPVFTQNLTVSDPAQAVEFITGGDTGNFKVSMVDRLRTMYPNKKWLAIGDSTQKDPEVYGEAIRKYGDSITCTWIRRVEGAENSDERFAAAFAGVPANKFRIFSDSDIPSLVDINVAGGEC